MIPPTAYKDFDYVQQEAYDYDAIVARVTSLDLDWKYTTPRYYSPIPHFHEMENGFRPFVYDEGQCKESSYVKTGFNVDGQVVASLVYRIDEENPDTPRLAEFSEFFYDDDRCTEIVSHRKNIEGNAFASYQRFEYENNKLTRVERSDGDMESFQVLTWSDDLVVMNCQGSEDGGGMYSFYEFEYDSDAELKRVVYSELYEGVPVGTNKEDIDTFQVVDELVWDAEVLEIDPNDTYDEYVDLLTKYVIEMVHKSALSKPLKSILISTSSTYDRLPLIFAMTKTEYNRYLRSDHHSLITFMDIDAYWIALADVVETSLPLRSLIGLFYRITEWTSVSKYSAINEQTEAVCDKVIEKLNNHDWPSICKIKKPFFVLHRQPAWFENNPRLTSQIKDQNILNTLSTS